MELKSNNIFQPKVEPTSKMLDVLVSTDRNYIKKKVIEFYYRYLNVRFFYVWLWVGNRFQFKGSSYIKKWNELEEIKSTIGDKINDTLSKIK